MEDNGHSNKRRNIIIGVAVVAVIGVIFAVTQFALTPASEVVADTTTLEDRIGTLETWKASTAETISNIQTDVDGITIPSYSGDIDAIIIDLEALKNDVLNLTYRDVAVTRVEDDYVDVTAYIEGNYPVILNLYGADLTNVESRFPTVYSVSVWGGNTTITAVITPATTWTENYVIELKVVGTVDYASACVGRGQGQTEEGW